MTMKELDVLLFTVIPLALATSPWLSVAHCMLFHGLKSREEYPTMLTAPKIWHFYPVIIL